MHAADRAWAEIDPGALQRNARHLAGVAGGADVFAIIKANGYGHDLLKVAQALDSKVDRLGVASLSEALELEQAGIHTTPYLLGTSLPEDRDLIVELGFEPTVSSLVEAQAWSELAVRKKKTISVHYHVDTGMGRTGFPEAAWSTDLAADLAGLPAVRVEAIASHFPSADEDPAFTEDQILRFEAAVEKAQQGGLRPARIHLANSAGILAFPASHHDAVRPGLALYGVSPLPGHAEGKALEPTLSLKSRVLDVRSLPKGHGISYGRSHVLLRDSDVASVGIGYGDGLPRSLGDSPDAALLIGGQRRPILGRITMDQILVDVTGSQVRSGDEVVVIGTQGEQAVTIREIADQSGTIPWEILTGITPRVVRRVSK